MGNGCTKHAQEISGDLLRLGNYEFDSRLLIGTGKFSNPQTMVESIQAADVRLVTVALRRFHRSAPDDLFAPLAALSGITLVPNTSGARTAEEAVRVARLAREICHTPFVKVEIHPNPHHLLPDPIETLEASRVLAKDGFVVLPYTPADPVLAKRLEDAGCAAVMPLGSPIGSGRGLQTADMLAILIEETRVPVIVDAGLRAPSEAAMALEMGCAAVLVNTAIALARDPPAMAAAFADAVRAGRLAYRAGLMERRATASPTSPITAFLDSSDT